MQPEYGVQYAQPTQVIVQQAPATQYVTAVPVAGSPGVQVAGSPAPLPANLPAGATYQGSVQKPDGTVIDRYVVPQRAAVPVRQVVPEVQQYQVYGETTVPEVRQIQVPQTKMVQVQETVMVPQVVTKMVPQQEMVIQNITVQKPVQTVQTMQRTIGRVVEGQKFLNSSQIIEYERPRMIPGRYLGTQQTAAQEAGIQWNRSYYTNTTNEAQAVTPPQITQVAAQQQVQYVQGTTQYVQGTTQYVQAPTQYVQGPTAVAPQTYYQPGTAVQANNVYASGTYFQAMPNYQTQPGYMAPQPADRHGWAGYDDKEGAF